MSLDLSGRTVLVTGAGRPLAASLTRRLTRLGAHVVTCDAYDEPGIQAALGRAEGRPGRIDALVNAVAGEEGLSDARTATAAALALMAPHEHGGAIVHVVTAPPTQDSVADLVREPDAGTRAGIRVNAVVMPEDAESSGAEGVAQLVGFLVSDDASSVDGRTLAVEGGTQAVDGARPGRHPQTTRSSSWAWDSPFRESVRPSASGSS